MRLSATNLRTALVVALMLSFALAGGAVQAQAQGGRPLYERLGGVYPIAAVVDEFLNRLLVSDVLNANPAIDAARKRVPVAGLKFHVTTLVCEVTGGPCKYTGRTMKAAHAQLNITEREWQEMVRVFTGVLTQFNVPAQEQKELLAIVESTKPEIVVAGPAR